jgi:glycine betaine/proline transport system ATP-binding protein
VGTQPNANVEPVIDVRNIWKIFGDQPAAAIARTNAGESRRQILEATGSTVGVADVSFSVAPGETFVVMGLSGSGKSTLVRCISRLIEPTSGIVSINGRNILEMSDDELREVRRGTMAMVFQHFGLLPHRRVIDNVAYGLEVQKTKKAIRRAHAATVLEKVGLSEWGMHFPHELSGGMQQRVGLARALALDPQILLFDEPFSALDPLIRREMQDELIRLQREERRTIVFITHDFDEAIRLGDRIAIMKDGVIDQIGTAEDLILHPATDYVREFTTHVPRERVLRIGLAATAARCDSGRQVRASASIADVLPLLVASSEGVNVVDDGGHVIGAVDRARLAALLDHSSAVGGVSVARVASGIGELSRKESSWR